MGTYTTFIGTYTDGDSEGIYRGTMDTDEGRLRDVTPVATAANPSFLAVDPAEEFLYAANEVDDGAVTAYRIGDDELTETDHRVIGPGAPCHVSVDAAGAYVFVAHYTGGAVSMIPIEAEGRLGDPAIVEHQGASVHPERQTAPHPHSANVGPRDKFLYVPDLGTDEIVRYEIDRSGDTLTRAGVTTVHDGAGPRHMAFHPAEDRAYVINELDSTLTAFDWQPSSGDLDHVATVSTLEHEPAGDNYPADLHVHPDGEFVYGSNRGEDSIAMFALDDGEPSLTTTVGCGGEWPRNFAITPDGSQLFVANEQGDSVVPYAIDTESGRLERAGDATTIPAPVCLRPLES